MDKKVRQNSMVFPRNAPCTRLQHGIEGLLKATIFRKFAPNLLLPNTSIHARYQVSELDAMEVMLAWNWVDRSSISHQQKFRIQASHRFTPRSYLNCSNVVSYKKHYLPTFLTDSAPCAYLWNHHPPWLLNTVFPYSTVAYLITKE